ncbi:MAG: response regulator transcription factor [Hymenobacter sp.]
MKLGSAQPTCLKRRGPGGAAPHPGRGHGHGLLLHAAHFTGPYPGPAAPRARPYSPAPSELVQLSEREQEVLRLICRGCTAADIAEQLFISRRTVEGHRQKLLEKTGAPNAAGLVVFAVRHGLLDG